MLELDRRVEIDETVDDPTHGGGDRTRFPADAVDLLPAGRPLDAAAVGAEPALDALHVLRRGAEPPSELPRGDPALVVGVRGILLRGEQGVELGGIAAAESNEGSRVGRGRGGDLDEERERGERRDDERSHHCAGCWRPVRALSIFKLAPVAANTSTHASARTINVCMVPIRDQAASAVKLRSQRSAKSSGFGTFVQPQ